MGLLSKIGSMVVDGVIDIAVSPIRMFSADTADEVQQSLWEIKDDIADSYTEEQECRRKIEAKEGELKQNNIALSGHQQETASAEDTWMLNLWRWADENDIDEEELPREKDKLVEVTVLQLFDRQLKTLPKEIGNLINLRELRLKRNQLAKLPREIGNLTNLEFLSLGSNNLTELPEELGNLTKLKGLWIGANDFSEIPEIVWSLSSLTGLSIARNNFTELPKEIGNLTNLRILLLSGNNFLKIPAEIGNLTHLRRLDICHTDSLTTLPKEIGSLTSLENLKLFRNSITELPKEIGNLSNLKDLYCVLPELVELPKEIGNLKRLLFLYLSGDSLTELPKEIGDLTTLTRLELHTGSDIGYHKKINQLLKTIREKNKTHAIKNSCYLKIDMEHANSFAEDTYLNLSIQDIYTEKGTFPKKHILRIIAQNFHKEIGKIEKKLTSGNIQMDTFDGFKILAAVDENTMITVRIKADGWMGFVNGAYKHYTEKKPPTYFKYINEEPYFDDLLNSNEPFWNGLSFAEVVLLHFKKIMKELTKDAVLIVGDEEEMTYWGVTEIEDFQKNPHITQIEKIIPIKERKTREAHKNDEDLQKSENIADNKKSYLEVTLTPDKYLDHNGLATRKKLFNSKTIQSLKLYHDSGNIYDSKAIKVFYDNTDIGFIIKQGTNGKVDDFCFVNNSFLEDVELIWENGKLILAKNKENQKLESIIPSRGGEFAISDDDRINMNTIYNIMGMEEVSNSARSYIKFKPVIVSRAIVTDYTDKEGRVRLPIVASNIEAILDKINKEQLLETYIKGMSYIAVLAKLPDGSKVKVNLDLFAKNSLLYHILRDQGVEVVMTPTDDYDRSYIDTSKTAEANGGDYASTIGNRLTIMLETVAEHITEGRYYLQLARPNKKLSKRKLSRSI